MASLIQKTIYKERIPMGPTPFSVDVYLADHTVEDRVRDKTHNITSQYEIPTASFTSQTVETDMLKAKAKIKANNDTLSNQVEILIDSPAHREFISWDIVQKYDLPVKMLDQAIKIQLADGTTYKISRHYVTITRHFEAGYTTEANFICLPSNNNWDVILGIPWLRKNNPDIHWDDGTIHERQTDATLFGCEVQPRPTVVSILSANQMAKLLYTSAEPINNTDAASFFIATLKEDFIGTQTSQTKTDDLQVHTDFCQQYDEKI